MKHQPIRQDALGSEVLTVYAFEEITMDGQPITMVAPEWPNPYSGKLKPNVSLKLVVRIDDGHELRKGAVVCYRNIHGERVLIDWVSTEESIIISAPIIKTISEGH